MKTNQIFKSILGSSLMVAALAISSCSSNGSKGDDHAAHSTQDTTAIKPSVKPEFSDSTLANVYNQYIQVKTAMVKTDAKQVQQDAAALQTAFTEAGSTAGADLAGKITSSSDIAKQRLEMEALTAEVEKMVRSAKITRGTVYKQYCPMANDGNGGYWLSSEPEVRNPYYGDEMLACGEVKEEIK